MNKQEKYINYIVGDLISKTEIDYEQKRIKFPSLLSSPTFSFSFPHIISSLSSHLLPSFSTSFQQRYGARDEEIKTIWDRYRERIQSLIKI
jgi:hypothetical protein